MAIRFLAFFLFLCLAASSVFAQIVQPSASVQRPDCQLNFTLTSAGRSASFDNRTTGCTTWTIAYTSTGFTALSLRLENAPDVSGAPGTWAAWSTASVTYASFPLTNTTSASATVVDHWPWVSANLVSITGTGTVTGLAYGFRRRDWELPNPFVLADNFAPGPSRTIGALMMAFDETNWDFVRQDGLGNILTAEQRALTDNTAFTGAVSRVFPLGALFDNTPPSILDGNIGAPRMDASRFLFTVFPSAQPISATTLPLPTGASTLAEQQTQTTALQLIDNLPLAQGSATLGQSGALIQGAVTTAAPTYTTAQTSPLSLQTDGSLRSAVTNIPAVTQSGTWTVQPGNTANTTAWLVAQENLGQTDYDTGAGTVNQKFMGLALPGAGGPAAVTSTNRLPVTCDNCGGSGGTAQTDNTVLGSLTGTGWLYDTTPPVITDGNVGMPRMNTNRLAMIMAVDSVGDSAMDDVNNALRVNIIAGAGSGGTAAADNSVFTGGTTNVTPMGALYDTTPPVITDGNVGAPRMDTNRYLLVVFPSAQSVSGSGTFTVDSELSAAAALADATANPTIPLVGAALEIFNGTTWDRARGNTTDGLLVDVTPTTPAAATYLPVRLSDGSAFITPGTDYTHDAALTVSTTAGPMTVFRASAAAPTNVSLDNDAVIGWALLNGSQVVNLAAGGTLITATGASINTNVTNTSLTVDSELPASAALADGAANPTTPMVGAALLAYNAATWDRIRGDTINGLDVDVTRLPALVAGTANIGDVDVASITPVTGTGTISLLNDAVTIAVGGYGAGGFQLTGTCAGGTATFEASVDGTNWQALDVWPTNTSTSATTTTANGVWYSPIGGLANIRIRVSTACSTGTWTANVRATTASAKMLTAGAAGGTSQGDNTALGSITGTGWLFDATPPAITDGNVGMPRMNANRLAMFMGVDSVGDSAMDDTNNAMRVNVVAGGAGDGKILDGTAAGQADVMATAPAGTEEGLVVRPIPSGTQTVALSQTTTNNDVDVLTLPALPAGTNNIGDVDLVTFPPDRTQSDTLSAVSNGTAIALNGQQGAAVEISGTHTGLDARFQVSVDGGTTYRDVDVYTIDTEVVTLTISANGSFSGYVPAGTSHVRMRVAAISTGSVTFAVRVTSTAFARTHTAFDRVSGSSTPSHAVYIGGSDGTNLQGIRASNAGPAGTEYGLIVRNIPSGTQTISGTVTANAGTGTFTVDSELPAAAALADAASAAPTTPTVGMIPLLMNATTVDRARAVVNALDSTGTGIAAAGLIGQLDDTATNAVTENQFAPLRLSTRRALLVEGVASGTNVNVAVNAALPTGANVIGALSANQSVNVAQINAVTPLMGNGVTGTGSQRITLSSDNSAIAGWGLGARGAAIPSGGQIAGVRTGANLEAISAAGASVPISTAASGNTQLVALSAGQVIHITGFNFMANGTTNFKFIYGTGTACATGQTDLTGAWNCTAQTGVSHGAGLGAVLFVPAGNALCVNNSAAIQVSGSLSYTQFTP